MSNPFTMFSRAAAGLHLTPGERALLKLVQAALATGALAILAALSSQLSSGHFVLSATAIDGLFGAGGMAFLMVIAKYFSAKGDAQQPSQPPSA